VTRDDELVQIDDVHRAIGAVVAAATALEQALAEAVASLTRSPLTALVVQGERGSALAGMARRLLTKGIGSSEEDENSGRSERLGLISAADTAAFLRTLATAELLFRARDDVVHSLWLANLEPGQLHGQRTTRSKQYLRAWTLAELEKLRQDLANARTDLLTCEWNTSGSGMERLRSRDGDTA
jgi:hypothetical protein